MWWGSTATKVRGNQTWWDHEYLPWVHSAHARIYWNRNIQYLHLSGGRTGMLLLLATIYPFSFPTATQIVLLGITSSCWAFSWFLVPASLHLSSPRIPRGPNTSSIFLLLWSGWACDLSLDNQMLSLEDFGFCACDIGKERGFRGWTHPSGACHCHSDVLITLCCNKTVALFYALWPFSPGLSWFLPPQNYSSNFTPILRASHNFLLIP